MADACVQTNSSQAGNNLDMDELEVQTASAALNLTDDVMCQEEADSDCNSDCDIDNVDDALYFLTLALMDLVCDVYFFAM